jgi:DNA-directed RNA polymerase subunit RPC12/RpoP
LIDLSKRVYICNTCTENFDTGDIVYFCLKCKEKGTHEHKLQKLKGLPGDPSSLKNKDKDKMTEEEKNTYLENLLEEYYNLDYEDVIGGGAVKTRFKYKKVAHADFGLTDDDILLLDDKQLGRLVSLKKLRPYIEEGEEGPVNNNFNIHRVINLKKQF